MYRAGESFVFIDTETGGQGQGIRYDTIAEFEIGNYASYTLLILGAGLVPLRFVCLLSACFLVSSGRSETHLGMFFGTGEIPMRCFVHLKIKRLKHIVLRLLKLVV